MRVTSAIPLVLLAALTLASVAPRAAQPRASAPAPLSIEQLIDIKHPSNPVWSRDGKRIAFTWDRAGEAHLYVVPADGSTKPVRFTTLPANVLWSHDSSSILFFLGNRLMTMALDGSAPTPRFADFAGRSPSLSRDGTRIVYLAGGAPDAEAAAVQAAAADEDAGQRPPSSRRRRRRARRHRRRFASARS